MNKINREAIEYANENCMRVIGDSPYVEEYDHEALYEAVMFGVDIAKKYLCKDAEGEELPPISKEVIVLCQPKWGNKGQFKVLFGHRVNPPGLAISFGKGGWNIPDVKYWLDVNFEHLK